MSPETRLDEQTDKDISFLILKALKTSTADDILIFYVPAYRWQRWGV